MSRILVAGVENVLRGDDGFGPAVAARLGDLPSGVEVVETGIGGVALLQELLAGCDGFVLVDAVDRGAAAGTLFELAPEVGEAVHVADVHLANPDRVRIVGCQPAEVDELGQGLSPVVERTLDIAAVMVRRIVEAWLREPVRAGL